MELKQWLSTEQDQDTHIDDEYIRTVWKMDSMVGDDIASATFTFYTTVIVLFWALMVSNFVGA